MNTASQDRFNFFIPMGGNHIEKAAKQTGGKRYDNMIVEGIASDSTKDTDEETLMPSGYVTDRFLQYGFINYDHRSKDNPKYFIGEPTIAKVQNNEFFVKGKLYKDNAVARDLWDTMIMLKKSDSKRKVGWSIEGKALERDLQNPKKITKALITGVALTLNPKNTNSYADIVKGEYSDSFIEYEYPDDQLIKSEDNNKYLVDIIDDKSGFRYTIDDDLKVNVTKAMDTVSAGPLIKEDLERKLKILPYGMKETHKKLKKGVESNILKSDVLKVFEKRADEYIDLRKSFINGDITKEDFILKSRLKEF